MNLLSYPFDSGEILQKKRRLKKMLNAKEGLLEKRVAILSGSTIGEIQNLLELFLLDNGIRPVFHQGEYSLFYEELVFDDGTLKAFAPDIIYIHTSSRNIRHWPSPAASAQESEALLEDEYARFEKAVLAGLRFGCPVILNNFDLPVTRPMGNYEASSPAGKVRFVRRLNEKLAQLADSTPNLYLQDLAYLQAQFGMDSFSDQTAWYAYKYCCAIDKLPDLCCNLAAIIKSCFGLNKKALALDLDNTLWGGIIGDDGPEGIQLGSESPTGMAYSEFQQYIKDLGQMGVLLNVDSKNEPANAKEGFAREDSILKEEDFLCFKANWEPKSQNLSAMAKEINILPESFVFVDDNPAEREIVRQQLPGVAVPEMTAPEEYARILDRNRYFEVTTLSADDRNRARMYKENYQRTAAQENFGSYEEYLKSLEMTGGFYPFDMEHAPRITQLINKTNQFNLTTRRYSAAQVEGMIQNPEYITLYGQLADKFGDNGIVSAIIGHREENNLDIELWIMSCRTFKRQMEFAMFDHLVEACRNSGITTLTGHYSPTPKNLLVQDFYGTIGFKETECDDQGNKHYLYRIPEASIPLCQVIQSQTNPTKE